MASIRKNFLYNSILTVSGYVFPLLVFPYVTRVLGVHNLGICNFIDSIIQYFILFSFLGMQTMATREIAKVKDDKYKLKGTFSSLISLNVFTTTIALIILYSAIFLIPKFQEYKLMLFIGSAKILANTLLVEWFFIGTENFKYITLRSVVIRSLYVVSVFVFIREKNDYLIYFTLTVSMFVINAIANTIYVHKFTKYSIKESHFSKYFKPYFILGAYQLLTSMYTSFNVAFLGFIAGEKEVGYYSVATKIYTIQLGIFTAFTAVMLPRMSALLEKGDLVEFKKKISSSIDGLLCVSMPIIVMSTMFAPTIIGIIAGKGYEGAIIPLRIIMPLILIIGYEQILILQVLVPMNKDRAILINSMVGAIVGIILNVILVKSYGQIGSSIVWVVSEVFVLIGAQFFVTQYTSANFPVKKYIQYIIGSIPAFIICCIMQTILKEGILTFIMSGILVSSYFLIIYLYIFKNTHVIYIINFVLRKIHKSNL